MGLYHGVAILPQKVERDGRTDYIRVRDGRTDYKRVMLKGMNHMV